MKIGYAQTVLTPALDRPVFLAGFGNNRRAKNIHDDLFARVLSISDGSTTVVLCALDLIGFFQIDVQNIIKTLSGDQVFKQINPHVVIASTHTHHGPDTMGLWGPDQKTRGVDEEWLSLIKPRIVTTILAALADMRIAEVCFTSVHVPGVAKNARNPEIVDDELTLAQFVGEKGNPLATLFDFPCHPEVLWDHNPSITSDYPGFLRLEVEKITAAPCIFFSGALGGMMTPDVQDHSFDEAQVMGTRLAQEGVRALAGLAAEPVKLQYQSTLIKARLTNILYKLAFLRKLLPDIRDKAGRVTSQVGLLRIGGLWLATVPGEMLPKLGLAVKQDLLKAGAQVAGVIGLANDELGYILPAEDFKYPWNPFNPGSHYEETNSIGKEIGPSVVAGIGSLL